MLVIGTRQQAAPEVVAPVELEVAEKTGAKVPVMKSVLKHLLGKRVPGFTLKVVED